MKKEILESNVPLVLVLPVVAVLITFIYILASENSDLSHRIYMTNQELTDAKVELKLGESFKDELKQIESNNDKLEAISIEIEKRTELTKDIMKFEEDYRNNNFHGVREFSDRRQELLKRISEITK